MLPYRQSHLSRNQYVESSTRPCQVEEIKAVEALHLSRYRNYYKSWYDCHSRFHNSQKLDIFKKFQTSGMRNVLKYISTKAITTVDLNLIHEMSKHASS